MGSTLKKAINGKENDAEAINDCVVGGIDRLGYKYHAQAIVKVLKNAESPLCVGLYGR